jgi:hypothetical protein
VQSYVAPGELCTLSVAVDAPGDSLGCIECWVAFDAALVALVDADEGDLFKHSGEPGLYFWNPIAVDTHSVEGCILGYRTYVLSPGEVARFVFRADAPGVCPVRIVRLNLWDIDRELLAHDVDPYAWIVIGNATGVAPDTPGAPMALRAYPNPFNPATTLVLSGLGDARGDAADVSIYSAAGRRVRRPFRGRSEEGAVRFVWDGRNDAGERVGSGVYFAVARAGKGRRVIKLVLLQ